MRETEQRQKAAAQFPRSREGLPGLGFSRTQVCRAISQVAPCSQEGSLGRARAAPLPPPALLAATDITTLVGWDYSAVADCPTSLLGSCSELVSFHSEQRLRQRPEGRTLPEKGGGSRSTSGAQTNGVRFPSQRLDAVAGMGWRSAPCRPWIADARAERRAPEKPATAVSACRKVGTQHALRLFGFLVTNHVS